MRAVTDLVALRLPRTLFAAGASMALASELAAFGVRRPLLVTDAGLVRAGLAARLIEGTGIASACYDSVTENPLFADVDRGALAYAREGCDGVVALGGGSVIDTAKYIAMLATNPGSIDAYMGVPDARIGPGAPLVLLPTTAGTGSEANPTAGIHPTADTVAVGIASPHLLAGLVIIDPELTLSLPPRLTAATGIDALSHCLEGYFSRHRHPVAEMFALDGAARAVRWVEQATSDGGDLRARSEMMLAAYAGGAAIQLGLGPAHAIAITCGDRGFHHGVLSGIGIVAAIDGVAAHQPDRARIVRHALGIDDDRSIGGWTAALMRRVGLPATLRELGYGDADVAALADAAQASFFNASAYHHPSTDEYAAMIGGSLS